MQRGGKHLYISCDIRCDETIFYCNFFQAICPLCMCVAAWELTIFHEDGGPATSSLWYLFNKRLFGAICAQMPIFFLSNVWNLYYNCVLKTRQLPDKNISLYLRW